MVDPLLQTKQLYAPVGLSIDFPRWNAQGVMKGKKPDKWFHFSKDAKE